MEKDISSWFIGLEATLLSLRIYKFEIENDRLCAQISNG